MSCPKCGKNEKHFCPPSLGEFLATLKDASPAVLKAIAAFHRKRAMVAEAKCARLEAEKQEAHTEGWNACVEADCDKADFGMIAPEDVRALSKPTGSANRAEGRQG